MLGTDLVWYRSAIGDTAGGAISATPITDNSDNNVWPNYSSSERVAGDVEHRKTFLVNEHASETLVNPHIWIADEPDNMDEEIGLGFDTADDADPLQGHMTAWSAGAVCNVVSDGADTRTVRVHGLVGTTRTTEDIVLNGTTPVSGAQVFTTVYAVRPLTTSGTRTITVRQGSGGTIRGTIGPGKGNLFLWLAAASKVTGLKLPSLAAGASYGFWHRQTIAPGATAAPSNLSIIACEPE